MPLKYLTLASMLFFALSAQLLAAPLPQSAAVPGGIAMITLGSGAVAPVAHFQDRRVMVRAAGEQWQAMVGIPLDAKAGMHELYVQGASRPYIFQVNGKMYAEQRLTIKNKRKVNPNAEDMKRIRSESGRIKQALRQWTMQDSVETRFTLPVNGRLSSPFGLRRFFNEQARKPHSGIDIAAPAGSPIKVPAAGRVIESGYFFFNGNSVFLDHGQGLVTMYSHMQDIKVQPGQSVVRGDIIGNVGQSGRATGPHLHWGVSLNDARVDPSLFFDDLNALLSENTASSQ